MEYIINLISLTSIIILIIWLCLNLPVINQTNWLIKLIFSLILVAVCIYIPIYHGFNLVKFIRGSTGDLSITSFFVLIILVIEDLFNLEIPVFNLKITLTLFLITTFLYLATFAIIPLDIYSIGYNPKYWLVAFIVIEMYFWYNSKIFAIIWLFGLIGFYFKLQESTNLWDYLVDPILYLIIFNQIITKLTIKKSPKN